jgi:hypothetical protein
MHKSQLRNARDRKKQGNVTSKKDIVKAEIPDKELKSLLLKMFSDLRKGFK